MKLCVICRHEVKRRGFKTCGPACAEALAAGRYRLIPGAKAAHRIHRARSIIRAFNDRKPWATQQKYGWAIKLLSGDAPAPRTIATREGAAAEAAEAFARAAREIPAAEWDLAQDRTKTRRAVVALGSTLRPVEIARMLGISRSTAARLLREEGVPLVPRPSGRSTRCPRCRESRGANTYCNACRRDRRKEREAFGRTLTLAEYQGKAPLPSEVPCSD